MSGLALFGGTFDPIHVGHLDVADAAREALGLDVVSLLPSRVPPHRQAPVASAAHRFAMVALAALDRPGLDVSDLEMDSDAPSYTSHTIDQMAASGVSMSSLFMVVGADAFIEIASWKDYPALLDRCHFAVVSRPGYPAPSLKSRLPDLARRMAETPCEIPVRPVIFLIDAPTAPVSSTGVRERLRTGDSIDGMVLPAVARYIEQHGLYGAQRRPS